MKKASLALLAVILTCAFTVPAFAAENMPAPQPPDYLKWKIAEEKKTVEEGVEYTIRVYLDGSDAEHFKNVVVTVHATGSKKPEELLWFETLKANSNGEPTQVRARRYVLSQDGTTYNLVEEVEGPL